MNHCHRYNKMASLDTSWRNFFGQPQTAALITLFKLHTVYDFISHYRSHECSATLCTSINYHKNIARHPVAAKHTSQMTHFNVVTFIVSFRLCITIRLRGEHYFLLARLN